MSMLDQVISTNDFTSRNWRNIFILFLLALPILSLFFNALSWLKYGIDLPLWDDWRTLLRGNIGDLSWEHLFRTENDTMSPVGFLLDSLFYRYLNGNVIAYQFISMLFVLGALLFFQWRLLLLALKDRLLAASAFSLTLFMLQPDSYWGSTSLAYVQALPLVFILAAVYIILDKEWNNYWSPIILLVLGLLAGFSYVSGAFSILAISIIFILISNFVEIKRSRSLLKGGLVLLSSGIITSLAQLWVIVVVQKGIHQGLHSPDITLAYPLDGNFWWFFLGKIARAFMLPGSYPWFSFTITSIIVAVMIGLIFWGIRQLVINKRQKFSAADAIIIYFTMMTMIFVYLCLVSAGRANFAQVNTLIDSFLSGFPRFHFFWVTLLFPWVIAIVFKFIEKSNIFTNKNYLLNFLSILMPILGLSWLIFIGGFKHGTYYQIARGHMSAGAQCLQSEVQETQDINCPHIHPGDLSVGLKNAMLYGVSFTDTIFFSPIPIGTNTPKPIRRFSQLDATDYKFENIEILGYSQDGIKLETNADPRILFNIPEINGCRILEVNVLLRVSEPSVSQIFYLPPGELFFSEGYSKFISVKPGGYHEINLLMRSPVGFDSRLRFDPVANAQKIILKDLEIRCRL